MTPYELGMLAARTQQIPEHLKQAYAQGFAGAFEKSAADWHAPAIGAGVGATGGALLNWLTTPEGMHWTRRVLPGLVAGGAAGGYAGTRHNFTDKTRAISTQLAESFIYGDREFQEARLRRLLDLPD